MKIVLIAAMSKNNVIGIDGTLPWNLPEDLKRFRKITTGNMIIMGRKTYESIGRPLPKRTNIILTRNKSFRPEGCYVVNDFISFIAAMANSKGTLFVIGGEEVYKKFLPFADELLFTQIDKEFKGDAYFPSFKKREWKLVEEEIIPKDFLNPFQYRFQKYIKSHAHYQSISEGL